jgi:hypothetical protein
LDYRKFLQKTETMVLPYLGGGTVVAPSRRLRVAHEVPAGWWRFSVAGRVATPVELAEPEDLSRLPSARGHIVSQWLFTGGRSPEWIHLVPDDQPPELAPVRARKWHSGDLLFEVLDFEGDVEDNARKALEAEQPLGDAKGITPGLRAAFGFALLARVARRLGVPVSPIEAHAGGLAVADGGVPAAHAIVMSLDAERRQQVLRAVADRAAPLAVHRVRNANAQNAAERAEAALQAAGARPLSTRNAGDDRIEVTFQFMGERFIAVADAISLQIIDAGVCLAGADQEVTLESLPSVIREAIETDVLVITRR